MPSLKETSRRMKLPTAAFRSSRPGLVITEFPICPLEGLLQHHRSHQLPVIFLLVFCSRHKGDISMEPRVAGCVVSAESKAPSAKRLALRASRLVSYSPTAG